MTVAVPATARSENLRGILRMLAAMAVFVLNDTLIKIAAAHMPTGEAIFLRGVFTIGFCLIVIMASSAELGTAARTLPEGAGAQRRGRRRAPYSS